MAMLKKCMPLEGEKDVLSVANSAENVHWTSSKLCSTTSGQTPEGRDVGVAPFA